MNVLWIIFVTSFVNISVSDDLEWNYPYYNLNKFLSYLVPHIWEGEQHFNSDGSYLFRYDTGHVHQSFRGEIRDSKGVIQGYYGYVDPNGVLRITEYISDNLGYRAKTTLRYQISKDRCISSHIPMFSIVRVVVNALIISFVLMTNVITSKKTSDEDEVIEMPGKAQVVKYEVSKTPTTIKLKCKVFKESFSKNRIRSVNELKWESKKCGYGLHLTNCGNFKTILWHPVLCKNETKFCDGYTLKFDNPTVSDSGYYRCLYKNYMSKQFKVYKMFYLDVYDPEGSFEILDEPAEYDNRVVHVNDSVTFRCRARSLSPLHMMWAKVILPEDKRNRPVKYGVNTYELLNSRGAQNLGTDLYISKLTIPNSQLSDNGQYYCIIISINNASLMKNKTVSLTVGPSRRNKGYKLLPLVTFQLLFVLLSKSV